VNGDAPNDEARNDHARNDAAANDDAPDDGGAAPRNVSFPLRYGRLGWLLGLLGAGRRHSAVELDGTTLHVHMGWTFRADIPRHSIHRATREPRDIWWAIGVHTVGRGTWLVNGAAGGIVWLDVDPPARARTLGVPITVRRLGLAVDDPDLLVAAIGSDG
jgi:hypothetical protein